MIRCIMQRNRRKRDNTIKRRKAYQRKYDDQNRIEKQEYDRKYYEKKTSRFIIKKTGSKARMPKKQGTSTANNEYKKLKEHYRKHAN